MEFGKFQISNTRNKMLISCILYMLLKPKSGEKCHNFIPNEHLTLHKLGNSEKMLNFAFQNHVIK